MVLCLLYGVMCLPLFTTLSSNPLVAILALCRHDSVSLQRFPLCSCNETKIFSHHDAACELNKFDDAWRGTGKGFSSDKPRTGMIWVLHGFPAQPENRLNGLLYIK